MSFTRRSIPLSSNLSRKSAPPASTDLSPAAVAAAQTRTQSGVRPSAQFPYILTASTGTSSLDDLLGLGAGLALGSILAIEEDGSTDYAGVLLSCFASQGILHGQEVFVAAPVGSWPPRGSLPGLAKETKKKKENETAVGNEGLPHSAVGDKMKIAWRYERLGSVREEKIKDNSSNGERLPFCLPLDLTTSLPNANLRFLTKTGKSFFPSLEPLKKHLSNNHHSVTRLILPSMFSPLYYAPESWEESQVSMQFIASLRLLVNQYSNLVVLLSWPLALFPRQHAFTECMKGFAHGVISLEVFPHGFSTYDEDVDTSDGEPSEKDKMEMQGLIRVQKLPVLSDRGMGLSKAADGDWAFAIGRRKMVVRPFNLPPVGEEEEQDARKGKKDSLEF